MPELTDGCVKPARGLMVSATESSATPEGTARRVVARVGAEALDFEANAFIDGVGFQPIKLSAYKGQWVVLCFYPGDFTFV